MNFLLCKCSHIPVLINKKIYHFHPMLTVDNRKSIYSQNILLKNLEIGNQYFFSVKRLTIIKRVHYHCSGNCVAATPQWCSGRNFFSIPWLFPFCFCRKAKIFLTDDCSETACGRTVFQRGLPKRVRCRAKCFWRNMQKHFYFNLFHRWLRSNCFTKQCI